MPEARPISIHRLRSPYRWLLVGGWAAIPVLLLGTVAVGGGIHAIIHTTPLAGLLVLMLLPVFYVWQEGIDLYRGGLRVRVHIPRYHAYVTLAKWWLEKTPQGTILCISNHDGERVFAYHCVHLTHINRLLNLLGHLIDDSPAELFVKNEVLPHD